MKVYIHLAFGFDASGWRTRWLKGEIVGLNEATPYGYHYAEKCGANLTFSRDKRESFLERLARGAVRLVLGFDLVHAWRNRRSILGVDAVWTHTESQHLAISLVIGMLSLFRKLESEPILVAQSVWLFDEWAKVGRSRRWLYRRLLRRASVLTVHSPENLRVAIHEFPEISAELVEFGIPSSDSKFCRPAQRRLTTNTKIIAVGNDRHRHWECLLSAAKERNDLSITVVSKTISSTLIAKYSNATQATPGHNDELREAYRRADIAVVPLQDNLHASGLTAVLEAIAYGVPVVVSDVGGLRHYFSQADVSFVPPNRPDLMLKAIDDLVTARTIRVEKVRHARQSVQRRELTSEGFARRHVVLTKRLIDERERAVGVRQPISAPSQSRLLPPLTLSGTIALRTVATKSLQRTSQQVCRLRVGPPHRSSRDLSQMAIVSSLARVSGISRGAELQHEAATRAGLNTRLIDVGASKSDLFRHKSHLPATAYVFHAAGPQTSFNMQQVARDAAEAWRIGYWAWELAEPPQDWRGFDNLVSEIWTPSRFAADSLKQMFSRPIRVVPHYVVSQVQRHRDFSQPFTVLVVADSRSSLSRKNPLGAINAFINAFGSRSDVRLLVKLNEDSKNVGEINQVVEGAANIRLTRKLMTNGEMSDLFRSADALLSLHRAEGFGLPMLEAMAHGVPVIGTGWSGNTDFMDETNSAMIPYNLVPVRDRDRVYRTGHKWAEPDIGAAVDSLRSLADDHDSYLKLAAAAHSYVASIATDDIAKRIA